MTSRLVAGMLVLLSVPGIAVAGDSRAKRSTGQTVGRAANLVTPKLQTQRTKSAESNTAASRLQLASSAPGACVLYSKHSCRQGHSWLFSC